MLKNQASSDAYKSQDTEAVSVPEKVRVLLPARLAGLSAVRRLASENEVSIEGYEALDGELVQAVHEESVVLVAEIEDYAQVSARRRNLQFEPQGPGRLLLMSDPEALRRFQLPAHRALDLLPEQPEERLLAFKLDRAVSDVRYEREVQTIKTDDLKRRTDLDTLNEIGMALSTEKDLGRLLDQIVLKCRQMTLADAGSLYLIESDPNASEDKADYFHNKKMRFQVAQNDSRTVPFKSFLVDIKKTSIYGYVALTQETLNFEDAYDLPKNVEYSWGGKEFDASIGYRTKSMLTVPMVNYRGETIGVIQLINRKFRPDVVLEDPETCVDDIQAFTEHDVRMVQSIASQASIAIQNAQLVNSIRTLFDGFIEASVKAIESRDPTTSGHSQRVATLTVALAEQVDRSDLKKFNGVHFNRDQLQEIRYASLLHDFGKIGVREHVLVKAKKLYPHEFQHLRDRFELIRTVLALHGKQRQLEALQNARDAEEQRALVVQHEEEMAEQIRQVEEYLEFITRANEPTVLAQGGFEQLNDIAQRTFNTLDGSEVPFLNTKELVSLSVPKGSLNDEDRKEIESHVTHTYKFLSTIPWTGDLRNVPEIAYAHHEKLDGTGYPNRLTEDKIPIQSKMMSISDIFDALTALDRPYKKALPVERALNILLEEANSGHVDRELLDLFIESETYSLVV